MTKSFTLVVTTVLVPIVVAFSPLSRNIVQPSSVWLENTRIPLQPRQHNDRYHSSSSSVLRMATVPPSESSKVGVIGRGYMSVLIAKLASVAGYPTWYVCPPGEEETVLSLITEDSDTAPEGFQVVPGSDTEQVDRLMRETDALMIATDDDTTMSLSVVKYLMSPDVAEKLKRVVIMSRNVNGKDMGFLVKASKVSANKGVWDGSTSEEYKTFEEVVKEQAAGCGADYTIARAGTLKGGGGGESNEYDQYLSGYFYSRVKKDIVNWNLLFDCNVRGVKLAKGDVLPGPGVKAVFTATSSEEAPGDTSRCSIAEAMVRSLAMENCANVDFGVGTVEGRTPPTDSEWEQLFNNLS